MKGKIILEEHVTLPDDNIVERLNLIAHDGAELFRALVDLHDDRLREMNDNGVEFAIISQNGSGPQGIHDPIESSHCAAKSNDYLASLVQRSPDRFAAFAALPMHDPADAITELVRCVHKLGMVGAMLNGGQEYRMDDGRIDEWSFDEPKYDAFWAEVQELDVPIYLHPKLPLPTDTQRLYKNRPWLTGPVYSFARDCSFQTLALCTSGIFDRYPRLKIILGHMGEMLLSHLQRMDHWLEKRSRGRNLPSQKTLREYFDQNIYITTAGVFSTPTLIHALTEIGVGRVLFSVDSPYESITEAASWVDTLPISNSDISKIGRENALGLFPKLNEVLNTAETAKLQSDRERVLFVRNPGWRLV